MAFAALFDAFALRGSSAPGDRPTSERLIDDWVRSARPRDALELATVARAAFRQGRIELLGEDAPLSVACLATLHRNGYIRERALSQLAAADAAFVAPYILLRTDDIVPSIRASAIAALRAWLRPDRAASLARCLGLLEALGSRRRASSSFVVDYLSAPDHRDALLDVTSDAGTDRPARLMAYRLLVRVAPVRATLESALADADIRIRLWAARTVVSKLTSDDDKRALLPLLSSSRNAWSRSLALRALRHLDPSDAPFESALLDPHATVRLTAREILRARHPTRPLDATRLAALSILSSSAGSAPTAAAVIGALGALADVGTPSDAPAASRLATDPRPRVRTEALRTLRILRA